MLVLTRKIGQRIQLGTNISLTVVRVKGGRVRVAIEAPKEICIYRGEIADLGRRNKTAAPDGKRPKAASK